MEIRNTKINSRQAAEQFAAEYFEQPRKVGKIKMDGPHYKFRLVDGRQWYTLEIMAYGWRITADMMN